MDSANNYVLIHGKNISHNTLAGSAVVPHMSIDKLFPALLECFGIILCGYIAGRADIITESQAKGLGNFVSKFALPALLFKNMVLLDFGDVIWAFLWSVLVAKVTVFVLVCVLTLMVASPDTRYSKAGLYAIFATQSNDFALGYPIVDALYRSTYPEYLQYIYLVAPVSLMLLNPIGFAFCEVQKWRQASHSHHSTVGIVGVVVVQVLKNPVVFMVIVGIVAHFALGQRIPAVLSEFIDGLANSFGGAALFYLGLTMVGQLRKLTRDTGVALILLITAKLLVMPLVCKDMVDILDVGENSTSSNHTSLSNFAFLYGVFPTAPSVAIYAGHYNMELEVVTSGMVISTFLSAPIMYVSAWLLTIPLMDPTPLVTELENVSFNISIVSLLALVWTIVVMLLSRKFNRLPHLFALNLFLAQFLVCVSMILWNFLVKQEGNLIGKIITFTLLYGSLYSTYIWTGLIPLCLALTNRDDLLRLRPGVFMLLGWGVPFLMIGALLIFGFHHPSLYKHFHKQHHEWTAPIGIVATYAHPPEHVLSNMLPVVIGPVILGSHVSTTSMWYCLALISTTISHCGYHLPFLPSPEYHDFHHLRFNQCFGVFGVLDRLHGTDSKFRQTKQYERHTLLTSLTPLNESIPDTPKKGQ